MTSIKGVAHKSRLFHFYLCQCIFDYCCLVKLMVKSNICRPNVVRLQPKGRHGSAEIAARPMVALTFASDYR